MTFSLLPGIKGLKFFSDTKTLSSHQIVLKKGVPNTHKKTPVLESLLNKVAHFQDSCKTYLLHAHIYDFIFLGKTFDQLSINYVVKNVKCKVMFTDAYLELS